MRSAALRCRAPVAILTDNSKTDRPPERVREIIRDVVSAGFSQLKGGGKGSHRKFVHPAFPGVVTISGKPGDDAKPYQEKQVLLAIEATLKHEDE